MVIRRQKIDRKLQPSLEHGNLVELPPGWLITINCEHHGNIELDFTPYCRYGREELAGQMRDAFWSLRKQIVGYTLQTYETGGLKRFWKFLDEMYEAGESITHLHQIDRNLIDRYLLWLEIQIVSVGKNKGKQLSLSGRMATYASLKTLLTNRLNNVPELTNPNLAFPRNPFPNSRQQIPKREPYSQAEQKSIIGALNKDLRSIHETNADGLSELQILIVHLLILALATGRNLQPLLDLRRNSLQPHASPDREFLITYKRKGYSTHATSLRKGEIKPKQQLASIPTNIAEHFRFLSKFTEKFVEEANPSDKDFVFVRKISQQDRKGLIGKLEKDDVSNAISHFVSRHNLKNDDGQPLALNISRLRPTMATELYRRTHDLRAVQQALGHAHFETTARHYLNKPSESDRNHRIFLEEFAGRFTRMEIRGKVLLAADGKIPIQEVENLLTGGYNTGIARCRNPFREDETVCKKFLACFTCPNMCVFEDDLWRLFSFYYRLLAERTKLHPTHWMKTYGPIIRRIDSSIASQFPADQVALARAKAQKTPHPTWKDPLL